MGFLVKRANEMLGQDWQSRLADQESRLRKHVPLSRDEGEQNAAQTINNLRNLVFALGYHLRSNKLKGGPEQLIDREEDGVGIPGREVMIGLPQVKTSWYTPNLRSKEAGLLSALTTPLGNLMDDAKLELSRVADEKKEKLTRVTSDPTTVPTFLPSLALGVPSSFMEGYQKADTDADAARGHEVDTKLERAKKEFEEALLAEYSARKKAASAGELFDGAAQLFIAGKLEKAADGEFNQGLGAYLALAALLGTGAHSVAKSYYEKRDPNRQKLKAVREAIQMRMSKRPPTVLVEPAEDLTQTPD